LVSLLRWLLVLVLLVVLLVLLVLLVRCTPQRLPTTPLLLHRALQRLQVDIHRRSRAGRPASDNSGGGKLEHLSTEGGQAALSSVCIWRVVPHVALEVACGVCGGGGGVESVSLSGGRVWGQGT